MGVSLGGGAYGVAQALGGGAYGVAQALGAGVVDFVAANTYLDYITSLGLTSGLVMHLPLDETTGTVAADSSGAGNDGTYTSGPVLGQAPLVAGFDASILGPGYIVAPDTMADPAIDSITARFDFLAPTITANTGLFGRLSGQRFEVYLISGGQIRFDFFDGVNLARITTAGTYDDGAAHSLCLRSDVFTQEIEMWIDGVSVGSASTSAVTLTPGTTTDFRLNSSYIAGPGVVRHGGPTLWTTPLSDVNCALMAAGAV